MSQTLVFPKDNSQTPSYRARAFVFADPRSQALLPLIEQVAPSTATVLIVGETGTGKELIARHVYQLSQRANKPFVAVNCGAFSESLIEGELFGYEKGAFTGAVDSRPGWFEAANGGTLFLDEIGDLPASLQVKLLRVLQERQVVRLGSRKPVQLDVRLIAATNVNLKKAMSEGRFREDLYYRLQVVTLPLLPLRERRADILPLARRFLSVYGEEYDKPHLSLDVDAETALFNYSWPGNIRELENIIQRSVLLCRSDMVACKDLDIQMGQGGAETNQAEDAISAIEGLRPFIRGLLDKREPEILTRVVSLIVDEAFAYTNSNQVHTANILGVTRNVIRTHLRRGGYIDSGTTREEPIDPEAVL